MNRRYQYQQRQFGLIGAIGGSLLINLPVFAIPQVGTERQLAQTTPDPTIIQEAPASRPESTTPLNPNPGIFNEPPYNRSRSTPASTPDSVPDQPTAPGSVTPPLPEQQQAPSATVSLMEGKVSVKLVNATNANITYQVIGDTEPRSLEGKSEVMLKDLSAPVTLTFKRADGGLLNVEPSTQPGILEATLSETTDLGMDKSTMRIQATGGVFLN